MLVRRTVPFPSSEVWDARVGLLRVLAPRVVGVTMHALLPMLRVVLVALRSHPGLRFTSLFRAFQHADPTASGGPTRFDAGQIADDIRIDLMARLEELDARSGDLFRLSFVPTQGPLVDFRDEERDQLPGSGDVDVP